MVTKAMFHPLERIRTNSSPAPRCPSTFAHSVTSDPLSDNALSEPLAGNCREFFVPPEPICRLENQSEPDHSETVARINALRDRAGCVHLACLRRASFPRWRSSFRIQYLGGIEQ